MHLARVASLLLFTACATEVPRRGPAIAHLGAARGDADGLAAIATSFEQRNPGYALEWRPDSRGVVAERESRILFVQQGRAGVEVRNTVGEVLPGELTVGDLVVLRPGVVATFTAPLWLLVFTLPDVPTGDVPVFVRPDWDPRITDTPGGCATETGAYRRLLLTWKKDVGPYTYQGLNAHRVRITDSMTHYHPVDGGFDEFYLVQMVQPGARLLTSDRVAAIEKPASVTADDAAALFVTSPLQVGDLVYLPRGLAHRGLGGVLAQVITVPGFVPGKEIGIDHHLRAINQRLGLTGAAALPLHAETADGPVVR